MKQEHYLKLARLASKLSDHHSHRLGAIIVRRNRILGTGHNMMKTHPKSPHSHKSVHAEFMAVLNAGKDIAGATVYVFREQKNGNWANSRPCKFCWELLMSYGVKNVVYSFEGSFKQEKIA